MKKIMSWYETFLTYSIKFQAFDTELKAYGFIFSWK